MMLFADGRMENIAGVSILQVITSGGFYEII